MLWRKKTDQTPTGGVHPARPGAKNRPTPKRRDQEAANKRPMVVADRKAAGREEREKRRTAAATSRAAMISGDESKMPPRDRGPVRRYIRDYVDARFSLGEILLPAMLLALLLSLIKEVWALTAVFVIVYGLVFISIGDTWLMWRRLKVLLTAKFGADAIPAGSLMYAVMRAYQIRRSRLPRPQIKRGAFPS
ncbi:MAG: DUF3043 domain-containing protein [Actinomycetales bacterium]|nr:DUF3043 domain-containing protein [Actinomycetales bacterium]